MGARGRKSAAELSVVGSAGIETVRRPEPPEELTDEQAHEWRAIVNSMPADWFPRGAHGTLVQLCRHRVRARRFAQLIDAAEAAEDFDVKEYRDLCRSEGENTRLIESCETKLRLTPQTQYDKTKKRQTQTKRPWETE